MHRLFRRGIGYLLRRLSRYSFLLALEQFALLFLLPAALLLLVKHTAVNTLKYERLYFGLFRSIALCIISCLLRLFFCDRLSGFYRCKMQVVRVILKLAELRNTQRIMQYAFLYRHKALIPFCKITLCQVNVYAL